MLDDTTRSTKNFIESASSQATVIGVKRLHGDAVIPSKAYEGDAGFDLYAIEDVILEPGETALVRTGLAFEIPQGFEMQIRPRSGVTLKTKIRVQLGTVDSGYRGEVGIIVDNVAEYYFNCDDDYGELDISGRIERVTGDKPMMTFLIRRGDRIAQGVIQEIPSITFEEVDGLGETDRGNGGFGSSGTGALAERELGQS